jgi:hypothetical protein
MQLALRCATPLSGSSLARGQLLGDYLPYQALHCRRASGDGFLDGRRASGDRALQCRRASADGSLDVRRASGDRTLQLRANRIQLRRRRALLD